MLVKTLTRLLVLDTQDQMIMGFRIIIHLIALLKSYDILILSSQQKVGVTCSIYCFKKQLTCILSTWKLRTDVRRYAVVDLAYSSSLSVHFHQRLRAMGLLWDAKRRAES